MDQRWEPLFKRIESAGPGALGPKDWAALGFREAQRIREGLERLAAAHPPIEGKTRLAPGALVRELAHTSEPDAAFAGLDRWLEAGGAQELARSQPALAPALLGQLCRLFAGTPALAEYLIHWPVRTLPVLDPVCAGSVRRGYEWLKEVRTACAAAASHAEKLGALRRRRIELILQIAALDLEGRWDLEEVVRALSDLADACIQVALEFTLENLRSRYGEAPPLNAVSLLPGAPPPAPFVVLAFGKLGGRELNYSSDIDLVFVYAGAGQTQGVERPVEHAEFFRRVGEELIGALDQRTEDGRAYRIDMRLRPYGQAGPLTLSLPETLAYLQAEGRTWERQAWIKARPVAGDLALGEGLLAEAAPFVYRRYLSLDAIGDMKALKRQIEQMVLRRGQTEDEVKLGRGGIRDVEFTVQFLQLLHGSPHPEVRDANTLRALRKLRGEGLLAFEEADQLEQAYLFLRGVEHRLQLYGDQQTHRLPADSIARRRLARSLGFEDAGKPGRETAEALFEAERLRQVGKVSGIFSGLFANLFPEQAGPEGELSEQLLAPEPDPAAIAKLLPSFGLPASTSSAQVLIELSHERLALISPARTRKFFASLAPLLLKALVATGEPEAALKRFSRIAGSLGGKAVFYQALHENSWLLKVTAELAAWSEYLTEILVAHPGLFDELVDALRIDRSKSLEQMDQELAELAQGGDIRDTLRAYRSGELLRIGVRDLIHSAPLEQTQQELTDLAAALLRAQWADTQRAFVKVHGEVSGPDGAPVRLAILGVGKLGGREMNYGSDLDVLFFYGSEGAAPDGTPAHAYFGELARELSRTMSTHTERGALYQLDARLRPNGGKGPLASSLEAFERYWRDGSLADWERLALTRVRTVAGDQRTGERAEHLIRTAVYSPLRSTQLAREVREMRRRLEETAKPGDIKRGKGGLVDIEFLVQYLQLVHGPSYTSLRQTNTQAALQALIKRGTIPGLDGQILGEAYQFMTRMANRVRIVHGLSANTLPQTPEDLQKLAVRAGYADRPEAGAGRQLRADHERLSQAVREIFERSLIGK